MSLVELIITKKINDQQLNATTCIKGYGCRA